MPGRFVVKKGGTGFNWTLLASNGKVIAASEKYETKRAALAGISSVQKNAAGARIDDQSDAAAAASTKTAARSTTGAKTATGKTTARRGTARKTTTRKTTAKKS